MDHGLWIIDYGLWGSFSFAELGVSGTRSFAASLRGKAKAPSGPVALWPCGPVALWVKAKALNPWLWGRFERETW